MTLEQCIFPTQKKLFKRLLARYQSDALVSPGNFILVKGVAPVMLVAHLDTVHDKPVRVICYSRDDNILMSPQGIGGDDRCGVYALVTVYELVEKKPWLLFTCDEEIGGLGARAFCQAHKQLKLSPELEDLKFIIEIDRRGSKESVFYDCWNTKFEDYVARKGFETAPGSFSDISYIAPELKVAAVNLASGYYNPHTQHEYIVRSALENTIEKVCEMVADASLPDFPRFEYFDAGETVSDKNWDMWDYTISLEDWE